MVSAHALGDDQGDDYSEDVIMSIAVGARGPDHSAHLFATNSYESAIAWFVMHRVEAHLHFRSAGGISQLPHELRKRRSVSPFEQSDGNSGIALSRVARGVR